MHEEAGRAARYDILLLGSTLALLGLGLVVVYSASSHLSMFQLGDSYHFLKRQALWGLLGLGLLLAGRYIPCTFYARWAYPLLMVSLVLLCALFVPGLGRRIGGATRWLQLGPIAFQPSEFCKFALAVYLAYSMATKGTAMRSFTRGVAPHLLVTSAFAFLLILQPDMGTAAILLLWVMILLFVGGARWFYLLGLILSSASVSAWLIWQAPYRLRRITAYLDPWQDPLGTGYQIIHSFLAFGSGGLFGQGLGDGKQKLFYLPEPHTDFALSVVGEELGFIGVLAVVVLFALAISRGVAISLRARDLYSTYLALGLTCFLALQASINMAVVLGLLPTKGLTLPFISYGGSSLAASLFEVGILLNIGTQNT